MILIFIALVYDQVTKTEMICGVLSVFFKTSEFDAMCSKSSVIEILFSVCLMIYKGLNVAVLVAFDYKLRLKVMTKKAREVFSENIREQRDGGVV